MPKMRVRIRGVMRRVMQWKFLLDVLTITLIVALLGAYWFPEVVTDVPTRLSSYWMWVLTIFVGAREAGRWVGDHQSGKYFLRLITSGEIYLGLFLLLPLTMLLPDLFIEGVATDRQLEVEALSRVLGLKVLALYLSTRLSKMAAGRKKETVERLSSWLNVVLGAEDEEGNNADS